MFSPQRSFCLGCDMMVGQDKLSRNMSDQSSLPVRDQRPVHGPGLVLPVGLAALCPIGCLIAVGQNYTGRMKRLAQKDSETGVCSCCSSAAIHRSPLPKVKAPLRWQQPTCPYLSQQSWPYSTGAVFVSGWQGNDDLPPHFTACPFQLHRAGVGQAAVLCQLDVFLFKELTVRFGER